MPELPEVEQVVRSLRGDLLGRSMVSLEVFHTAVLHEPLGDEEAFQEALTDRVIQGVRRRGKYILLDLDQGHLICHLRMTGKLMVVSQASTRSAHRHLQIHLSDGRLLVYDDVRRFGGFALVKEDPLKMPPLNRLGVEPLDEAWSGEVLYQRLRGRAVPIKNFLLDQHEIAGIGNIYADEALFRAGIRPRKRSNRLTRREAATLFEAIQTVLQEAIRLGGSTIRDYRDGHGEAGSFQDFHQVYGRAGKPCFICHHLLKRIQIGGRTTVYCPHCQRS